MSATVGLGVLLSGSGRTLQNLLDCITAGTLDAEVRCVISERSDAYGLERARQANVPAYIERDFEHIYELLRQHQVELVCLAGYLRLLPIAKDYRKAVINIHPALLPKYGGKGFYGRHVHSAVIAAGETESGCTVHYCDEEYDHGQVLVQKRVPVLDKDTPDTLAARVFAAECEAYPQAIAQWAQEREN